VASTPLKNMKVSSAGINLPSIWKNKKCSKPPPRDRKKNRKGATYHLVIKRGNGFFMIFPILSDIS
jgi:hypothetical protein